MPASALPRRKARREISGTFVLPHRLALILMGCIAKDCPAAACNQLINLQIAATFSRALGTKLLTSTNSGSFEPSGLRSEQ